MPRRFIHSITILGTAPGGRIGALSLDSIALSDLPATGTPSSSTYLRGDGTWATISGGGTGTVTSVDLTAPAAGITVSGGPVTSSGSITLALANDLAALEALTGTNTIYYRSGADTWSEVTIGSGLSFSGGTLSASGGGSGTVTSVALSLPAIFTVSGSPVTTTGTLTATLASQTANTVFAAPSGANGAPTFRTIVTADLPTNGVTNGIFRQSAGLSVVGNAAGATANVADITAGTDGAVLRRSGSFIGFGAITLSSANAVTGTLPIGNGGTGVTGTPTNGQLLIGNGTGYTLATLTAGAGVTITNGAGSITIAASSSLDINGLTATDAAVDDTLPIYDTSAAANRKLAVDRLLGMSRLAPGGRLTLTSGTPVTTTDVTGATTIRYTPYLHDLICLWDGTRWVLRQFAEVSLALGTLVSGRSYDAFGYLSGGALALELLAWTSATARATAITLQDGRYCKSGDKTRLYLGTFYTTSTTATADSAAQRFVWNMYNRVRRHMVRKETGQWNYTTATWRQANASTANQLMYVCGLAEDCVRVTVQGMVTNASAAAVAVGVGVDSTSVNSADAYGRNTSGNVEQIHAFYTGTPSGVGYHFLAWLEYSGATGTTTWYGDAGAPTSYQCSISGEVMA